MIGAFIGAPGWRGGRPAWTATVSAAQSRPDPTTTGGSARVTLLKGGEMGELLTVYVPRNESEVQRLLADSRDTEAGMVGAVERTQKLMLEAEGRVPEAL